MSIAKVATWQTLELTEPLVLDDAFKTLINDGIVIDRTAEALLSKAPPMEGFPKRLDVVKFPTSILGLSGRPGGQEIFSQVKQLGSDECHPWLSLWLWGKCPNLLTRNRVVQLVMNPIEGQILRLENVGTRSIRTCHEDLLDGWSPQDEWISIK